MVGSNYDPVLPSKFKELNEKYSEVQVHEVYGSIRKIKIFGSARPDFRVPDVSLESFEQSVKDYNEAGILVNYTDNTPIVDKAKIDIEHVKETLAYLKRIGIGRLTVAHPLSMEIIAEYSDIPVEISTIYRANTPYQLRELKRRNPNINKVCLDVALNRNFESLALLKKEGDALGIETELLANEYCITDCADRVQCYNEHAQCKTDKDASKFKRYPMGICTQIRNIGNPVEWTRSRFIAPQSMAYYNEVHGIKKFKVTGRTHPTPYILWIVETYLSQKFEGNLLELWADVKNIARVAKGKTSFMDPKYDIDIAGYGTDFIKEYENPEMKDLDFEYAFLENRLESYLKPKA